MVFANIEYLFLLLLLIPYIVWYIMKRKNSEATLQISIFRMMLLYLEFANIIRLALTELFQTVGGLFNGFMPICSN